MKQHQTLPGSLQSCPTKCYARSFPLITVSEILGMIPTSWWTSLALYPAPSASLVAPARAQGALDLGLILLRFMWNYMDCYGLDLWDEKT